MAEKVSSTCRAGYFHISFVPVATNYSTSHSGRCQYCCAGFYFVTRLLQLHVLRFDRHPCSFCDCSRSRMPPPDWSREHGDASTVLLRIETSIGCQYGDASTLSRGLGLASAPVSTRFGVDIGLPVSRLSACINCMLTPFAVVFVQPRWTFA